MYDTIVKPVSKSSNKKTCLWFTLIVKAEI